MPRLRSALRDFFPADSAATVGVMSQRERPDEAAGAAKRVAEDVAVVGDAVAEGTGPISQSITTIFFDLGGTLGAPVLSPPPVHLVGFDVFDFAVPVLDDL